MVSSLKVREGNPAHSRGCCCLEIALKWQLTATETPVSREARETFSSTLILSQAASPKTQIYSYSDNTAKTFSIYGCKYPPYSHLHLICSSHNFQCLVHRLMGFDQRKPLEIIMQIHPSVNAH